MPRVRDLAGCVGIRGDAQVGMFGRVREAIDIWREDGLRDWDLVADHLALGGYRLVGLHQDC